MSGLKLIICTVVLVITLVNGSPTPNKYNREIIEDKPPLPQKLEVVDVNHPRGGLAGDDVLAIDDADILVRAKRVGKKTTTRKKSSPKLSSDYEKMREQAKKQKGLKKNWAMDSVYFARLQ